MVKIAKIVLEEYLEKHGITKNEFARILGVNSPSVRIFFKEGYNPKLSTINNWAEKLDCSVFDLLREENVKKKKKSTRKSTTKKS